MSCWWESSRRPHLSNQFCSGRSVANKPSPNRQWLAQQWSQVQKWMKWEQVWHQAKNTTVGLELMASLEADEIGASVAPGKNHYSRVRVDGANVLINSSKQLEQMC